MYSGIRRYDRCIVAIKQVPKGKVKRWGKIDGFKVPIEFDLLNRVHNKHDSIISMLDWYERRTSYVLIMERPPNSIDLFEYINKKGVLVEDTARHMIKQLVEVMITCIKENVFHRDIKDENILVCGSKHQVKLIDFGCGTNIKVSSLFMSHFHDINSIFYRKLIIQNSLALQSFTHRNGFTSVGTVPNNKPLGQLAFFFGPCCREKYRLPPNTMYEPIEDIYSN